MPFSLGFWANQFTPASTIGNYDLISTVVVPVGGATSISFTSIPQTYKHLQVRYSLRSSDATTANKTLEMTLNGNTSLYTYQQLYASSTTVTTSVTTAAAFIKVGTIASAANDANFFGNGVIDLIDYSSTNKRKNVKSLFGLNGTSSNRNHAGLNTGFYTNDNLPITSLSFKESTFNLVQYSRISLYGIKG